MIHFNRTKLREKQNKIYIVYFFRTHFKSLYYVLFTIAFSILTYKTPTIIPNVSLFFIIYLFFSVYIIKLAIFRYLV